MLRRCLERDARQRLRDIGEARIRLSDPRGMYGARLEVEAHIVTASTLSVQNLVKCVNSLNIDVDQLVLAPLAAGEAVLTPYVKITADGGVHPSRLEGRVNRMV